MATREEVQKLAALARISLGEEELDRFTTEFDAILAYVSQLETLSAGKEEGVQVGQLHNVMRADGEPHPAGIHTEKLVRQFPEREGGALMVKQIITHE